MHKDKRQTTEALTETGRQEGGGRRTGSGRAVSPTSGWRWGIRRILRAPLFLIVGIWFVVDALFWAVFHTTLKPAVILLARYLPLARRVARITARAVQRLSAQLDRLGPYPTLLVVLLPLALLEPAKPVGLWLITTGRWWTGLGVLGLAELIKFLLIDRLVRRCLPKLLTIGWFAAGYHQVMALLARLRRRPAWRWLLLTSLRLRRRVARLIRGMGRWLRRLGSRLRMAFARSAR